MEGIAVCLLFCINPESSSFLMLSGNPREVVFIQDPSDPLLSSLRPSSRLQRKKSLATENHSFWNPKYTGSSDRPLRTPHLGSHSCSWRLGLSTIPCFQGCLPQLLDSRSTSPYCYRPAHYPPLAKLPSPHFSKRGGQMGTDNTSPVQTATFSKQVLDYKLLVAGMIFLLYH